MIEVGDVIIMLCGSRVLYVLRLREDRMWTFAGHVYVWDTINGQVMGIEGRGVEERICIR